MILGRLAAPIFRQYSLKTRFLMYVPRPMPLDNRRGAVFGRPYSTEPRNFLSRLLTRKRRAWTRDDIWAMFSWLFVGNGVFILVGTTTFASIMLLLANSLQFHDWLARQLTKYLANHTGLEVSFGDLIVPNWRTGRISFRNVAIKSIVSEEAANYALYDLNLARAEVKLSMRRLLEGRGLVQSCDIEGIRGTIDRRRIDRDSYVGWRHKAQRGDFDLEGLNLKDVLVTILSPDEFRPYTLSIISADVPRLRKRFLLYDFLAAESIVGMMDGSLFSMHIPQTHDRRRFPTMRHFKLHALSVDFLSRGATSGGPLNWLTRGSVDIDMFIKLPSDHSDERDAGLLDKLGTVTEGFLVEILRESGASALIEGLQVRKKDRHGEAWKFPFNFEISEEFKSTFLRWPFLRRLQHRMQEDFLNVDTRALEAPEEAARHFLHAKPDTFSFKVDFRFHNLRAHAPWSSTMRPLVAYINEQRPFIPLSCHFDISRERFDGAWTLYEAGIIDALSTGTTKSFELLAEDRHKKIKRLKKVSLWSLYALIRNLKIWMSESGYLLYPRISVE